LFCFYTSKLLEISRVFGGLLVFVVPHLEFVEHPVFIQMLYVLSCDFIDGKVTFLKG